MAFSWLTLSASIYILFLGVITDKPMMKITCHQVLLPYTIINDARDQPASFLLSLVTFTLSMLYAKTV